MSYKYIYIHKEKAQSRQRLHIPGIAMKSLRMLYTHHRGTVKNCTSWVFIRRIEAFNQNQARGQNFFQKNPLAGWRWSKKGGAGNFRSAL